jgi:hypothetical protein
VRADGYSYMADSTGQPLDKIEEDTDRDFFMTPEEAMEYGIIDEVCCSRHAHARGRAVSLGNRRGRAVCACGQGHMRPGLDLC